MSKWAIFFLVILLVACDKSPDAPALRDYGNSDAKLSIPSSCTFSSSGVTHTFDRWGYAETADAYSCSLYDRMTCNLYVSDVHAEILCEGSDYNNPQGQPSECAFQLSGYRQFLNGLGLTASASECGVKAGSLYCYYYKHTADTGCDNYDGSAANDCGFAEDNRVHEDLVCLDHDYSSP